MSSESVPTGPRGLVLAVILQAVKDWKNGDETERNKALRFFYGPVYRFYIAGLGLPDDWLPDGVTPARPEFNG